MATSNTEKSPGNWLHFLYKFFTSFKLATLVLVLLTFITLFGTLAQVNHGLVASKRFYFDSWFLWYSIKEVDGSFTPVFPFAPGGMLLMVILFTNMLMGAIVKVKKRLRGIGLLISHSGMLLLLAGGFVSHKFGTDGFIALYPGMKSSKVESYREWQLELIPVNDADKAEKAFVIPTEALNALRLNQEKVFPMPDLPFDVKINSYAANSSPIPTSAPMSAQVEGKEIDGFKLANQELSKKAEQNLPGAYVEFVPKEGGDPIEAILWSGSAKFDPKEKNMPFQFRVGDQRFAAQLAKKTWRVPYEIELDEFIFERHPGTGVAKEYRSRITRFEEGKESQSLDIRMNEPMRYGGYVFFQESFGPPDAPAGQMYSQFAVANNPADQWPLIAVSITGLGLLIHFCMSLNKFVSRTRKSNKKKAEAA